MSRESENREKAEVTVQRECSCTVAVSSETVRCMKENNFEKMAHKNANLKLEQSY